MSILLEKLKSYEGRPLTTDEAAEAQNTLRAVTAWLESLEFQTGNLKFQTGKDMLTLKFGTWKAYDLKSERARELMSQYQSTFDTMSQRQFGNQEELMCRIIDEVDGVIMNDWDGEYYTKQQAKDYIMNYGKAKTQPA